MAVIIRLAYFNCKGSEDKLYFTGLAVTYSAFFISLYVVITKYIESFFALPIECIYIFLILAFLWNKKIRKPNLYIRTAFLILAIVFIALLLI